MTFCLIRCEMARVMWKMGYATHSTQPPGQPAGGLSLPDRAARADDLRRRLEERYLQHCDTTKPFFYVCVTMARLIIARTFLIVYYPFSHKGDGNSLPSTIRGRLFSTSIQVLELSNTLLTCQDISYWNWNSKTHIQWHAVALALSEICSRPPSVECDRAWEYTQTLYNRWKVKEHKGNLWRLIRLLMAKAQYVREVQNTNNPGPRRQWRVAAMPAEPRNTSTPSTSWGSNSTPNAYVTTDESPGLNDWGGLSSTEGMDSFFGMLPEQDLFGPNPWPPRPSGVDCNMANWVVDTANINLE